MSTKLRSFVFCLSFLILETWLCQGLFAQSTSGIISGFVQDSTGGAVPGADITIKDVGKGTTYKLTTNESGNYTQSQLTPGDYTVSVGKIGFKNFQQQNVTVSVGQSTRVDARLELGEATQEITVSSAPPALETDRAEVQTRVSSQQVSSLPVLNRNFTNLSLLTPGATLNTYQHAPSENPQQSTLVNTNGQLFGGTNYQLDGMNNNDAVLGITMVNPAVDSVAEFTAATSNYDAEYRATGAVINVQTKSGSNEFHGSAFEFLQNDVFQARDSFTQGLHDPGTPTPHNDGKPALRWNQFGGSFSGPIVKNKLFFFADYQGTQRRIGASQTLRVPTALERSGNLSDLVVPIYDPATGNPDGTGRALFAGNVIPASRLSGPALNVLNALPLPNIPSANAGANNYSASGVEDYPTNQFDVRVDQFITDKLHYFARYSYLKADVDAPAPFGLYGGNNYPSLQFEGNSDALNQNIASDVTYTFGPTLLTDVRFGFSRYRVNVTAADESLQLADTVGIPGLNIPGRPDTNGLPQLNIAGLGGITGATGSGLGSIAGLNIGFNCNCPLNERETLLDFTNNWTKILGNHSIRFGGNIELAWNLRLPSDSHRSGVYDFNPNVTSAAGVSPSGLGLASFLLGAPSQFGRFGQISTNQEDRQNRMGYFVQDTWRVTPKLTLTYGLRWDVWFPDFSLNSGQGGRYDVTTNTVLIPGVGGISKSGDAEIQYINFSPRVGIAYAINSKTVIRTGYGRGFSQGIFGWTFNNIAADVYPSVVNQNIQQSSPFQPVFPLTTAPPGIVFPTIPSNGRLLLPGGVSTSYIPANLKMPYVDQWNFTVERQLVGDLNLSVGYVGNIGRHLNGGFNLNAAVPGPGSLDSNRPLFNLFAQRYGITGFNQSILNKCDCTSSNYNALQVQATKRFSQAYSIQASFTWSKAMDFGQATNLATNQYNAQSDYGPSDFDREYVFTLAHTFELPFGPGKKFLPTAKGIKKALVADWTFRGITSFSSGLPFSPILSNTSNLNSDMSERANVISDPTSGFNQNRSQWYNPAAFGTPALYTFGNASRNSIRGPNYLEMDWSISRNFKFRERYGLEFRWEVFNAINRTNLALPSNAVDGSAPGLIQDVQTPMRNMQIGAHLTF
jgi:hypothetical protein